MLSEWIWTFSIRTPKEEQMLTTIAGSRKANKERESLLLHQYSDFPPPGPQKGGTLSTEHSVTYKRSSSVNLRPENVGQSSLLASEDRTSPVGGAEPQRLATGDVEKR